MKGGGRGEREEGEGEGKMGRGMYIPCPADLVAGRLHTGGDGFQHPLEEPPAPPPLKQAANLLLDG